MTEKKTPKKTSRKKTTPKKTTGSKKVVKKTTAKKTSKSIKPKTPKKALREVQPQGTPALHETDQQSVEEVQKTEKQSWYRTWRTRRKEKKARLKESRSLGMRITVFSLKTLFIRIPLIIIVLLAVTFAAAELYLTPERAQNLIVSNFNSTSNGKIKLEVKEFSPFTGFAINNINITSGPDFNRSTFVTMKRLVFRYSFFRMLTGSIRFPEIGIYKPRVYLTQKNGKWNFETLMKSSDKKEKKKEAEKKEPEKKDTSKEINLPVSVDFLLKFILDDLRVYVRGDTFKSTMEGLTFSMDILVPPFKTIPKSIKAVSLLRKMKIILNPRETMNVSFHSQQASVVPPLILTWKLIFEKNNSGNPKFKSAFKFGTYRTPVRFKNIHLAPLNFMVSYDMFYDPYKDHLKIYHLGVTFKNKKWVWLAGSVSNIMKTPYLNLSMEQSYISLNDLYPYFTQFTGDYSKYFSGSLSLFPLTIQGIPSALDVKGNLLLRSLYFKQPGIETTIPRLIFNYTVSMRGSSMNLATNLSIPWLSYRLKGRKSGINAVYLSSKIQAINNFATLAINNINLRYHNPQMRLDVLQMALNGRINLSPVLAGSINIYRLRFNKTPLKSMLPVNFHKMIEGIPLKKPVNLNIATNFSIGRNIAASLSMGATVPDFNVNDLKLTTSIYLNNSAGIFNLKRFSIYSREWNLKINSSGFIKLKPKPVSDSNLRFSMELNNPRFKVMQGPWKLKGRIALNANMKGSLDTGNASGAFIIENLNIRNDEKDMRLALNKLNMNFPFEYRSDLKYEGKSKLIITKKQVIDSSIYRAKPNFTIESFKFKHPARNIQYEFLKDFSANMSFKENVFQIANLKAYTLDGSLYSRSILFYLADFKPEHMEYRLIMDITNIDISKLDEPNPKKKRRDAELSLSANFSGRGVNINRELTTRGFINIHKIGTDFAKKLMQGLSEEKGKSKLGIGQGVVDNTMKIKSFNFNLDKGLVYATVTLKKGIIGLLVGVTNTIKFNRIPIQEYLRKVTKGDQS